MTRGKWVALAVVLAVIAVVVLNGPALWMAVAYDPGVEERVFWAESTYDEKSVIKEGRPAVVLTPRTHYGSLVLKRKRYEWLPGRC